MFLWRPWRRRWWKCVTPSKRRTATPGVLGVFFCGGCDWFHSRHQRGDTQPPKLTHAIASWVENHPQFPKILNTFCTLSSKRVWQEEENESLRIRLKRLARPDAKAAENMVSLSWTSHEQFRNNIYLAILGELFGMVKWAFQKLSDLQLGNKKVTLYHLVYVCTYIYIHTQLSRSKNH